MSTMQYSLPGGRVVAISDELSEVIDCEVDNRFIERWDALCDDAIEILVDSRSERNLRSLDGWGGVLGCKLDPDHVSAYQLGVVDALAAVLGPDGFRGVNDAANAQIAEFERQQPLDSVEALRADEV